MIEAISGNAKYPSLLIVAEVTKFFLLYKYEGFTIILFYKKIELDPELIMKYLCVLERMEKDDKTKAEKQIILPTHSLVLPKDKTKNIEIFNAIENYYMDKNLIEPLNLIKLCLIYYIILSIPKKNLVFFNKELLF